jgi:hypothetical protein
MFFIRRPRQDGRHRSLFKQMPYQSQLLPASDRNSFFGLMLQASDPAGDASANILAGPKWQIESGSEKRVNKPASTRR